MANHLRFAHGDKRKRPYWRSETLLGKTFLDKQHEGVLVIGKDVWTRQEMVENLKCGNFVAAANLSKIAHKLQVDSLQQLASRFTMGDLFVENGCGITTMYVLMCALEAQQRNPLDWIDRKNNELVTLSTEHNRARKEKLKQTKQERADRRKKAGAGRLVPASDANGKGA
jgi:hypothetical protein